MTIVPTWEPVVREGQGKWDVAGAECIDVHELGLSVVTADSRTTALLTAMGGPEELANRLRELGQLVGDYEASPCEPLDVWIGALGTTITGKLARGQRKPPNPANPSDRPRR